VDRSLTGRRPLSGINAPLLMGAHNRHYARLLKCACAPMRVDCERSSTPQDAANEITYVVTPVSSLGRVTGSHVWWLAGGLLLVTRRHRDEI
jgi:hypothetical protein